VVWYTAAAGGTVVPDTTPLASGATYYGSLVDAAGCASTVRLAVTVNVGDVATPTTANATQNFCTENNPTVADIQVNQTGIAFYNAATGGTAVDPATALVNGMTYYASLTNPVTGCESAIRLAITVNVGSAATPTTTDTTQEFCDTTTAIVADIQVNEPNVTFYTDATGGTAVAPTTPLVSGTTYYASLTDLVTGCESAIRLAITVTVGNVPTPTTNATAQNFCVTDNPTVADIQVNEAGVVFYSTPVGGTAYASTDALLSGTTYYASLTSANGCESVVRLAIAVTVGTAATPTTADDTQDFCQSDAPTVASLQVNEPGVIWYTTPTGGTPLDAAAALVDDVTYYGSLAAAGCESTTRLAITVNINNGITPTGETVQTLCTSNSPTIADIVVNEAGVVFYATATGGTALATDTALVNGTTYYVSYTDPMTGCDSAVRLAVLINLSNGATPTTTNTLQSFCEASSPTVADLQVNEAGVVFYGNATGGIPYLPEQPLVNGATYYASVTNASGCVSSIRLAITVQLLHGATPTTMDGTQTFCTGDNATIADIQVNEPGVIWYATPSGGTPLASTDPLMSGSVYFGSLETVAGCESEVRLVITVTLSNGVTPTTQNNEQAFCAADLPTVEDIQINQDNITYYTQATGGAPLPGGTPLTDGTTYYASYLDPASGCPSAVRLAIQVTVNAGTTPTTTDTTQEFCGGGDPIVADILVNEAGVEWYSSATGGTPLADDTALVDGATYYASIVDGSGCESGTRLAVTITLTDEGQATLTGGDGNGEVCFEEEVTYTTDAGNTNYVWTVTGGEITAGGTAADNSVTIKWNVIGTGTVEVSYTGSTGCTGVTSATITENIISCADLTIMKTVDENAPSIGENVIFTITVKNEGQSVFTDIVVDEKLPTGYMYVNSLTTMGEYDHVTGVWTIDELLPGEEAELQIEVTVVFGGEYMNTATITESTPIDFDPGNNRSSVSTAPTCLTVYNEFTPNGDGLNEVFVIDCIENYPNNKLEVFNRYGNPVFKTVSYKNDWDGTANVDGVVRRNEKLPVGTYYYVLEVDGVAKTGWLYIMR
jgi:gliding motility-associated-like protein/uncharacterized repeat protein (TIGR01451 family)